MEAPFECEEEPQVPTSLPGAPPAEPKVKTSEETSNVPALTSDTSQTVPKDAAFNAKAEGLRVSRLTDEEFEAECMRHMTLLSTVTDFMKSEGDEALRFLRVASGAPSKTERRSHLAESLAELHFASIFKKVWDDVFLKVPESEDQITCDLRLKTAMIAMWNSTDKSTALCQQCLDCSVHHDIFRYLDNDKLSASRMGNPSVVYTVKGLMGILHNIEQKCDSREAFRECQAFTILQRFLVVDNVMVKCKAQLLLAYIISEDENDVINSDDTNIVFLLKIAADAMKTKERHSKRYGFRAVEIINGLNKLAANDSNKTRIVQNGGLPYYVSLMDEQCSPDEQFTAARGIWVLAFKCKDEIIKEPGCLEALERLSSNGENDSIKKEANGALWILKEKQEDPDSVCMSRKKKMGKCGGKKVDRDRTPSRPTSGKRESLDRALSYEDSPHVMISYQWQYKSVLLRVRDQLIADGYKVWMDVDDMSGSILEAMALAIEKAAVVIVCLSQKYKESPSCRTEAEYTFRLQKDIVPLVLQPRYRADGWLGALCGNKLYFDFSKEEKICVSLNALVKELGDRGKLTDNSKPGQSDGQLIATSAPTTSTAPTIHSTPANSADGHLIKWTNQDVLDWLEKVNLARYSQSFTGFDGKLLVEYRQMHQQAPEFFFKSLEKLGLSLVDSLRFTASLTSL